MSKYQNLFKALQNDCGSTGLQNEIKRNVSEMYFLPTWRKRKPKIKEECLLMVATKISDRWEYTLFQILKSDGENEQEERCYYWGIYTAEGDEWGDYEDLSADLYCMMPLLK